jgi:hypothetical protein
LDAARRAISIGMTRNNRLSSWIESELSSRRCLVYFEGEPAMTELEVLTRNINGLKELLRVAWRDLANPVLTPFERREARNQMNQYSAELRRHLRLVEAELDRSRQQALAENVRHEPREPKFRVLA